MPSRQFVKDLPRAKMASPNTALDTIKYVFWRLYTPLHPYVRDAALALHVVRHEKGRQRYLLGRVAPHCTIEEVVLFLVSEHGFGNHFVAWYDDGQVVSLRRVDGFAYQYHLRIFHDGEIRGHYEYTPEYKPIEHIRETSLEERRDIFLQFLGDYITV